MPSECDVLPTTSGEIKDVDLRFLENFTFYTNFSGKKTLREMKDVSGKDSKLGLRQYLDSLNLLAECVVIGIIDKT
jgi:hypothetical protein